MNGPTIGKLISVLGNNCIGKTTQTERLAEKIETSFGIGMVKRIKYPVYGLGPSGSILDAYLRGGNPHDLSPREAQIFFALNRTQFEPQLKVMLNEGIHVVAEDYIGTSIAWGTGAGVDMDFLIKINEHLLKEDLTILLDGKGFSQAKEARHKHENDDDLMEKVREIHMMLANKFGWHVVRADNDITTVRNHIWDIVEPILA